MDDVQSDDRDSALSVVSSPVALSEAILEQFNRGVPKSSADTLDWWLSDTLCKLPPSAFDLLPFVTVDVKTIPIIPRSVESQSIAPSQGPATGTTPEAKKPTTAVPDAEPPGSDYGNQKSIFAVHFACVQSFAQLGDPIPQILCDNLGRFRVWTANSGAHRRDTMSLDHRLRESANLKELVIELLEDLNSALQEGQLSWAWLVC